ncbi:type II secretion system F family protein [uncultured Pseudodesulfovibrio sp.]|uniref:type II secretion system F family protein n=1 Tax=uncultured Pseudodesulfovibrio sp. TaxID=2035858 RepID=UPI0029C896F3|nr:type II secretion system F family protein [uncultured Pseudodesulfovibrio sp.]
MPVFKYKAASSGGKKKSDIIDAASRTQAARKLREQGLFPLEITQVKAKGTGNSPSSPKFSLNQLRRVPRDALASTIRQLATLLNASMPLDKALNAIIKGEGKQDELQRIMTEVRETVREGGDLATAFSKHPNVFNTTFITMIRAGENSGTLDIVMERLADHIDQQLALRRKVQATMAYPVLMMIVGVCVVIFLLSFVVPKVTEIFFDMERALPTPTRILITVSDLMRKSWDILLLIGLALGYGGYKAVKTPKGKAIFDDLLLNTPVLGDLIKQLAVGRFAKTFGMLLKNGVSLVSALEIVKSASGNEAMKAVIEEMHHDVQEGKPLTGPLESSSIFQHATVQMIAAGEQSGRLDELLLIVADDCESKVNSRLQMLTSLMEPVMILILGGMVGFVVLAIMLPIFEMSNLVGG